MYKARFGDKNEVWKNFGMEMIAIAFFGLLFLLIGYWSQSALQKSLLQNNASLVNSIEYVEKSNLLAFQFPIILAVLIVFILGLTLLRKNSKTFIVSLERFYFLLFVSVIIFSFSNWLYTADSLGLLESVWTISNILFFGTIAVLGHVYVRSRKQAAFTKVLFPFLPNFSKVAWIGVSLQILYVLLSPAEGLILNAEFSFIQLLFGLAVLSGAVLGGPVLHRLKEDNKVSQKVDFIVLTFGASAMMFVLLLIMVHHLDLVMWNLEQLILALVVSLILALFGVLVAEYDN